MKKTINLLPEELEVKGPIAQGIETLKKIVILLAAVFLVIGGALGAYALILVFQIRDSQTAQENLKTQIASLEQAEQQLVLVKDRIAKARPLVEADDAKSNLDRLGSFLTNLPAGVNFTEGEIDLEKTEISFNANSSLGLSSLLSSLSAAQAFDTITLQSFSFNPNTGYLVSLELKNSNEN